MGLIDRLHVPGDEHSPFARALSMRAVPPAREDQSRPGSAADSAGSGAVDPDTTGPRATDPDAVDPGAAVRALLKEIELHHNPGIISPSHLFSILHRHLRVTSGVILVPEQDERAFSPMAAVGLDPTSRFRLRVPEATVNNIFPSSEGTQPGARFLEGRELEIIKPFLSRAVYDRTLRIAALPFVYNRDILAVLLVFDSPLLDLDLDVLDVLLAAFAERAGYLLFDGRHKPLNTAAGVGVLTQDHLPAILARLRKRAVQEKRETLFLRVTLRPLLEAIVQSHPHLDRDHLKKDLFGTCALLCADNFSFVSLGSADFLLAGLSGPYIDGELIVHQLSTVLQQLFGVVLPVHLPFSIREADDLLSEN
jgi:hypothetical protein